MDSKQKETTEGKTETTEEDEELMFRQMKSMSLVTFPKKKSVDNSKPLRNRCFSYAYPKKFVPKLHPQKAKIKPTPILLNKNQKKIIKPIQTLNKIEEAMSLSFENKQNVSSSFDSDEEGDDELKLNIEEEKPNNKFITLRRMMSKFTINNKRLFNYKDDFDKRYYSPSLKKFLLQEENFQQHFKSFRHTFDYFKTPKCSLQRGFSIINILEMTSGLK